MFALKRSCLYERWAPSLLWHALLFKALSNSHPELQESPKRTSHGCLSFRKVFLRLYVFYLLIYPLRYKVSSAPTQPLTEVKPKHGNCNCYDLKCVAGQSKVVEQPPHPEPMGEPMGTRAPSLHALPQRWVHVHHHVKLAQPHLDWLASSYKEDTIKQKCCFIPPVKSMNWLELRRVLQSCKCCAGWPEELVLPQSMPLPAVGCNASPRTQPSTGCVFFSFLLQRDLSRRQCFLGLQGAMEKLACCLYAYLASALSWRTCRWTVHMGIWELWPSWDLARLRKYSGISSFASEGLSH